MIYVSIWTSLSIAAVVVLAVMTVGLVLAPATVAHDILRKISLITAEHVIYYFT
jgi:hypothetical protein